MDRGTCRCTDHPLFDLTGDIVGQISFCRLLVDAVPDPHDCDLLLEHRTTGELAMPMNESAQVTPRK